MWKATEMINAMRRAPANAAKTMLVVLKLAQMASTGSFSRVEVGFAVDAVASGREDGIGFDEGGLEAGTGGGTGTGAEGGMEEGSGMGAELGRGKGDGLGTTSLQLSCLNRTHAPFWQTP